MEVCNDVAGKSRRAQGLVVKKISLLTCKLFVDNMRIVDSFHLNIDMA